MAWGRGKNSLILLGTCGKWSSITSDMLRFISRARPTHGATTVVSLNWSHRQGFCMMPSIFSKYACNNGILAAITTKFMRAQSLHNHYCIMFTQRLYNNTSVFWAQRGLVRTVFFCLLFQFNQSLLYYAGNEMRLNKASKSGGWGVSSRRAL